MNETKKGDSVTSHRRKRKMVRRARFASLAGVAGRLSRKLSWKEMLEIAREDYLQKKARQ